MRSISRRLIQAIVLLAFVVTPLFAAPVEPGDKIKPEKPVVPKRGKDIVEVMISVRSIDAIKKAAKACGYDLPPSISPAVVEMMFPFVGKGNCDGSRPIGAAYMIQRGLGHDQRVVFALPVKNLVTAFKFFREHGAPLGDKPNTFLLGEAAARLKGGYLIFGSTVEGVCALDPAALVKPYADKNKLAHFLVDLADVRKLYPKGLFSALDEDQDIVQGAKDKKDAEVTAALGGVLDGFDDLGLSLYSVPGKGFRLRIGLSPVQAVSTKPIEIPQLPKGCVGSIGYALPGLKNSSGLIKAFASMVNSDDIDDSHLSEADRKKRGETVFAVCEFLAGGRATTWAMQVKGPYEYFYVAKNIAADLHKKRLQNLLALCKDTAHLFDETKLMEATSYKSKSGQQVSRLIMMEAGAPDTIIDFVQTGDLVRMTIANDPGKHVEQMLALKQTTKLNGGMAGWLEGKRVLDTMLLYVGTKYFAASEEMRAKVRNQFDDKGLSCKATVVRGQMHVDVDMTTATAKALGSAMKQLKETKELEGEKSLAAKLAKVDSKLKDYPDWGPLHLYRADYLLQMGQPKKALSSVNVFLKKHAEGYDGIYVRAAAHYMTGDLESSRKDFEHHLKVQPRKPVFPLLMKLAIAQKGGQKTDIAAAQKDIEKALATSKRKSWPWPLFRYMSGKVTSDEVLRYAAEEDGGGDDKEHTAEAHYAIGIKSLIDGRTAFAKLHFGKCAKLKSEAYEPALAKYELSVLEKNGK